MTLLILGLVVFLGVHSVRIFADDWRTRQIARLGAGPWKGLYSVVSLVGFVLIIWGYGLARAEPVVIWNPPLWTRHVAALLTIPAFILLIAAYIPRNGIKAKLRHPMILGVKVWALRPSARQRHAGRRAAVRRVPALGDARLPLFAPAGSCEQRHPARPVPSAAPSLQSVVGLAAWAVFAFWLHARWIGVSPFGA